MVKSTELDGSIVPYDYDQLRRLSTAMRTGTNPFTQVYAYGSRNNRSSFTDGGQAFGLLVGSIGPGAPGGYWEIGVGTPGASAYVYGILPIPLYY